jgi:CelD/BcsL family acetyltransferase involved in cellulose biosynthesis
MDVLPSPPAPVLGAPPAPKGAPKAAPPAGATGAPPRPPVEGRPPPPRPALPGTPAREPGVSVFVARSRADLEPYVADWEELVSLAVEPNVFYEPWMLLPAMEAFGRDVRFEVVLVFGFDEHPRVNRRVLCGLFPLERLARRGRLPLRHRAFWKHDYAFLCAPLLRRGRAAATLDAFLDALEADRTGGSLLRAELFPGDGPVHAEVLDALNRRGAVAAAPYRATRAFLRRADAADAYLERALEGKRRKEYRRQERRLAETARLAFDELDAAAPRETLAAWLDEFLRLEASGWKGREGTAFASKDADRRWLETVAAEAHRRGRLTFLALRLDGKAVAMKVNFLAGDGAFTFKIAFDEAYARFSPGVLLELENVRRAHARPGLAWMDSCAVPDHFMANRLWTERRAVEDLVVATGGRLAALLVAAIPFAKALRRLGRRGSARRGAPAEGGSRMPAMTSSTGAAAPRTPSGTEAALLEIDPQAFRAGFDRTPFRIRHRLADHPLFTLPRLVELGQRLPEHSVEYNAGEVPVSLDPAKTPRTGLSVVETIRRIEDCRSWMVLKHVEQDPEYRALLDACLEEIRAHAEPIDPGMCEREGYVFVTSPGSVTPMHLDLEHNFLLQVRGWKTIHQYDRTDGTILPQEALERICDGAHRNLVHRPEFDERAWVNVLRPGDGLHFPISIPHWVKNGDEVSISFSITFKTPAALRRQSIHRVNARLRRRGLHPAMPGQHPVRDALKFLAFRTARGAARLVGKGPKPRPAGS